MPPFRKIHEIVNIASPSVPVCTETVGFQPSMICTKVRDDLLQMVSKDCTLNLRSDIAAAFVNVSDRLLKRGGRFYNMEMWNFFNSLNYDGSFLSKVMFHHLLVFSTAQVLECYDLPNGAYLSFLLESAERWQIDLSDREKVLLVSN
ncbi:MAG: hypothetical protein P1V18_04535 [Candidatus Gracilibacteria bacterium]|nr:hypothetical protein [Candidatus Gracilibacteria bacterium]